MLPPSALPRLLRSLQLSRPPALRDDDYRLPPVIVLPLWILLIVVVLVGLWHFISGHACASVVLLLVVIVILYIYIKDFNCLSLY